MNTGGRIIWWWRKKRGLTQSGLGLKYGASGSFISRIESGERPLDDPEIELLTEVLDTDPETPDTLKTIYDEARGQRELADVANRRKSQDRLAFVEGILADINNSGRRDRAISAIDLLPRLIGQLQGWHNESANAEDRKNIEHLTAKASIELVVGHTEIGSEANILGMTEHSLDLLDAFNYTLKKRDEDREDYEMAKWVLDPATRFVAFDMETCSKLMRANLKNVSTSLATTYCLREAVLASPLLAEVGQMDIKEAYAQLQRDKETVVTAIAKGNFTAGDRALIYESLACACSHLGDPEAPYWLGEAEKEADIALRDGTSRGALQILLARTGFHILIRQPDTPPKIIENEALQAIHVFDQGKYNRHRNQVIYQLHNHENNHLKEVAAGLLEHA